MSKVNRNCFLSVDSCLLDLSVGSIFKIDKLSRISWKSIHSVLASRIHLFGGVGEKKPAQFSVSYSDLCNVRTPARSSTAQLQSQCCCGNVTCKEMGCCV